MRISPISSVTVPQNRYFISERKVNFTSAADEVALSQESTTKYEKLFVISAGYESPQYSRMIASGCRIPSIVIDDVLSQESKKATNLGEDIRFYVSTGQSVPDDLITEAIAARLTQKDCKHGCVFIDFPATTEQAIFLDKLIKESAAPSKLLVIVSYIDNAEKYIRERKKRFKSLGIREDYTGLKKYIENNNAIAAQLEKYYAAKSNVMPVGEDEDMKEGINIKWYYLPENIS